MKRVKDNYEIIRKKINHLLESNFELEQKIKIENHRYSQINSLLKEYKNRINDMVKSINEMRVENGVNQTNILKTEKGKTMNDIFTNTENMATNIETEFTNINNRLNTVSTVQNKNESNSILLLNKNYKYMLNKKNYIEKNITQ